MALDPAKINFARVTDFMPIANFNGMGAPPFTTVTKGAVGSNLELGLSADSATATLNNNTISATLEIPNIIAAPSSWSTGRAHLANISGVVASLGGAAVAGLLANTDGDGANHLMRVPNCWDRAHPIYFRPVWATSSTTTTQLLKTDFAYTSITPGTTQLIAPLTALDTAVPDSSPVGTARVPIVGTNGVLNGGTLTAAQTYITLLMERKAGTTVTGNVWLIGLEIEYTPRYGLYHRRSEAAAWQA